MFWYLLLLFVSPLCSLPLRLVKDDRNYEILALRQQLLILRRQLGKRPRLSRGDKLALLLSCLGMKRRQLVAALLIVRPATLVSWHRQIVRRHWTFRQKRKAGRPRIGSEAERLVLRIARENPNLGYGRIAGEMRKLGYTRFGRSSVKRILERHGLAPRPTNTGLSWHDSLGHYGQFIWACDFFTVTTASLRTYYVLFFIEISSRRIIFWNVSQYLGGSWVAQQFRNLSISKPRNDLDRVFG